MNINNHCKIPESYYEQYHIQKATVYQGIAAVIMCLFGAAFYVRDFGVVNKKSLTERVIKNLDVNMALSAQLKSSAMLQDKVTYLFNKYGFQKAQEKLRQAQKFSPLEKVSELEIYRRLNDLDTDKNPDVHTPLKEEDSLDDDDFWNTNANALCESISRNRGGIYRSDMRGIDLDFIQVKFGSQISRFIYEKLSEFEGISQERMIHRFARCTPNERIMLKYLNDNYNVTTKQLEEIFKGAHVKLEDGGDAYDAWLENLKEKRTRISSHYKGEETQQYGIQGKLVKEMLFGKAHLSGSNIYFTWFQLEGHSVTDPIEFIAHMGDYFKYQITGENQGPEGSSIYTDNDPLVLTPKARH